MAIDLSPASMDLGLGGALQAQVANETEDERKKRLALQQQQKMLGAGSASQMLGLRGAGLGSPAGMPGVIPIGR